MNKHVFSTIIFDFFDVLHVDYQKAWLRKNGYTRSGEFAAASDDLDKGLIPYREYHERYAKAHGKGTADDIIREFEELASIDLGVVEIILELRELGYKTGLISNAHGDELKPLLEKHSFNDLFDEIVISGEEGIAKPDTAIFEIALSRLGVSADKAIFTDDNPDNIKGSKDAGITSLLFTTADNLRKDLQNLNIL